jgi:diadenylate cyclase
VLPLSSQQKVGTRSLGTRHRAGLGLTEQADVVALIVSEETGSVSVAYQGDLDVDIPMDTLKVLLQERLSALAVS